MGKGGLEASDLIEWEDAQTDWSNDIVVGDGAHAAARVTRELALAVVAHDKEGFLGDDRVDFAAGWRTWLAVIAVVWVEAFGVCLVIDGHDAIDNGNALARKSNYTFDDKFVGRAKAEVWILEDDHLAALRDVLFVL